MCARPVSYGPMPALPLLLKVSIIENIWNKTINKHFNNKCLNITSRNKQNFTSTNLSLKEVVANPNRSRDARRRSVVNSARAHVRAHVYKNRHLVAETICSMHDFRLPPRSR